ncbi:uncharacterized protein LOC135818418 isoform X2 [Sycon ciliatum]|uniref:uncharacterized protein LOC135818418 isoform X2 n=1 Tax=Sycon ciliatum TaxID=27933 RepID=UPI0031F6D9F8
MTTPELESSAADPTVPLLGVCSRNACGRLALDISDTADDGAAVLKESITERCVHSENGRDEPLAALILFDSCRAGHVECAKAILPLLKPTTINQLLSNTLCHDEAESAKPSLWSALHLSCYRGFLPLVELLLQHGAQIDVRTDVGLTPMHYAARQGHLETVRFLHSMEPGQLAVKSPVNMVAIHAACAGGHLPTVQYLLEQSDEPLTWKSSAGKTPLYYAAEEGRAAVVTQLLEKDTKHATIHANGGIGPIQAAAAAGHLETVKSFLDSFYNGEELSSRASAGETAFYCAARYDRLEILRWIGENYPGVTSIRRLDGCGPMHAAAQGGHVAAIEYLWQLNAVQLSWVSDMGETALHYAAEHGNLDVVKWIVEKDANQLSTSNTFKKAPIHIAAGEGHLSVVKYLLECNPQQVLWMAERNRTPIYYAAREGFRDVTECLLDINVKQVSFRTQGGFTPLHGAAFMGQLNTVKYLLERSKEQATWKAANGYTPLHLACDRNHPNVIPPLTAAVANFMATDEVDRTALEAAVAYNNTDSVGVMLDCMWQHLSRSQALKLIKKAYRYSRQNNFFKCQPILEEFLIAKEFAMDGMEQPDILTMDLVGAEGSGKSTMAESLVTTSRVRQLLRQEHQADTGATDLGRRTKGIASLEYVDVLLGHTVHLRDLAGQEQFAVTHDLFSISAPSSRMLSCMFVNATDDQGKITRDVMVYGGNILSRIRPSRNKPESHPIIVVATRGDKVRRQSEQLVYETVCRSLRVFKGFLSLRIFVCLDARSAGSKKMSKFREDFRQLVVQLLKDQSPQPKLLRQAQSLLKKIIKRLGRPFSTKQEFLEALCHEIDVEVPGEREESSTLIDKYVSILAAYGKVVSFEHGGALSDIVVNQPPWLLQDVVGIVFSPQHFPLPHVVFSDGLAPSAEVIHILDTLTTGSHGACLLNMLRQLGVLLPYRDQIMAPAFLPEASSLLGGLGMVDPDSVCCGLEFNCEHSIPFSAAAVVQVQTHLHDYFDVFHDTRAQLQRNSVSVLAMRPGIRGAVVFAPTHLTAYIIAVAPEQDRHSAACLLHLLRSKFLATVSLYSPGTAVIGGKGERVLSPASIRLQLTIESRNTVLESYGVAYVHSSLACGNKPLVTPSGTFTDSGMDTLLMPATHVHLLPRDMRDTLRALISGVPTTQLSGLLKLSEGPQPGILASTTAVTADSERTLETWMTRGSGQTTSALYALLVHGRAVSPNLEVICQLLEVQEERLSRGFPDVFYSECKQSPSVNATGTLPVSECPRDVSGCERYGGYTCPP